MNASWAILDKHEKWTLLLLLLLAIGLRIGYLAEISSTLFITQLRLDELYHHNWATSIASGNFVGNEIFFRAPLYPYLLGLYYALFGHSYIVPRIIQHVLGSLNVIIVYFLSRKLFGKNVATISSLLFLSYAPIIYNEDKLLFESILIPQVTLFIFLLYSIKDKPTKWKWFAFGLFLGIICITRPVFLPFLAILLIIIFLWYRKTISYQQYIFWMMNLIIGTTIVIAPVTLRNYLIGDDFVLIASQGGINLYIGNNPESDGFSSSMPGPIGNRWNNQDITSPVQQAVGRLPKASEIDSYWRNQAFKFIIGQPLDFLKLTGKKLYLFWNNLEIPNNGSFYLYSQFSKILTWLPTGFWLIGPLGLLGMIFSVIEKRGRVLMLFILFYMCIIVLFFVCDRFRLPIVPFLCIYSGFSIQRLWEHLKEHKVRLSIKYIFLLAILSIFVNSNIYNFQKGNRASDLFSLGNLELSAGNYEKAISFYNQIPADNNIQDVHLNWGVAEWRLGKIDNAIKQFQMELKIFPESYDALTNLAQIYLKKELFEKASRYARQAIKIKPYSSLARIILSFALIELQQYDEAETNLTTFLKNYAHDELYTESVLAGIHLLQGKSDLAENEYRSILNRIKEQAQPGYEPEFQYSKEFSIGGNWKEFKGKIYYSLGHIFLQKSNYDSALAYFTKSTENFPNLSDAWISKANTLLVMNQLPASDTAFSTGLKINPANFQAWYDYGLLLVTMNRIDDARQAFKNALKYNPDFSEAEEELKKLQN